MFSRPSSQNIYELISQIICAVVNIVATELGTCGHGGLYLNPSIVPTLPFPLTLPPPFPSPLSRWLSGFFFILYFMAGNFLFYLAQYSLIQSSDVFSSFHVSHHMTGGEKDDIYSRNTEMMRLQFTDLYIALKTDSLFILLEHQSPSFSISLFIHI